MATSSPRTPSPNTAGDQVRERVREHRQRLRAQGLRPVQIWVPDVRSSAFAAAARAQALAVGASAAGDDDQAFIDAVSDFGGI